LHLNVIWVNFNDVLCQWVNIGIVTMVLGLYA